MLYNLIISLPMIICFFWSIFFLVRCIQPNKEPRVSWSIWLFYVAASILYFDHWLYFSGVVKLWGEWSYGIVNLCVYPLYYAYLRALTRAKRNWEIPVLFIPAMVTVFLFPIGRYTDLLTDTTTFFIVRLCFMLQVIWVLIQGYRLLIHTIRHMDNTYSDDRSRLLRPTHIFLLLFGLTSVMSTILNFLGREFFTLEADVTVPAIVMSVLLYGLGFIAAHTTLPEETVSDERTEAEAHPAQEAQELIHRIDTIMRERMLYTNPNLTIQDLATIVNSNRTYVSNAINRTYHISFSQYVAQQRVAYAQLILKDPRYKTDKAAISDAIALSGFASDQTFYRVFKEITGQTPAQFRKNK